ncbi:MAG: DNA-3-methyladenine glycosylase I [Desulfobacterales bacterium]
MRRRCQWAGDDPLCVAYHDSEWGVPLHDDTRLFEFLVLEGTQAGLSWRTILLKRENYRRAFDGFDPVKVAGYCPEKVSALMADAGLIRNRMKIEAAVGNARAFRSVQERFGSFDRYIWQFTGGRPVRNTWRRPVDVPAWTPLSAAVSRDLKIRGFKFVGPTICYAFMQAVGMVNDHTVDCFRHHEIW